LPQPPAKSRPEKMTEIPFIIAHLPQLRPSTLGQ
jgi:hypothetical protein